jgi:hypothetical protein
MAKRTRLTSQVWFRLPAKKLINYRRIAKERLRQKLVKASIVPVPRLVVKAKYL